MPYKVPLQYLSQIENELNGRISIQQAQVSPLAQFRLLYPNFGASSWIHIKISSSPSRDVSVTNELIKERPISSAARISFMFLSFS